MCFETSIHIRTLTNILFAILIAKNVNVVPHVWILSYLFNLRSRSSSKSQPALAYGRASVGNLLRRLERVTGLEPVSPPWQGDVIALIRYPRKTIVNCQLLIVNCFTALLVLPCLHALAHSFFVALDLPKPVSTISPSFSRVSNGAFLPLSFTLFNFPKRDG